MAAFPLAIAGAVIGGGLSFFQTRERNKAIERAAIRSQQRINKLMTQIRLDAAIQTEQLSRAAQKSLGVALNVSPEHIGSLEAIALQVDGVFSDQFAIDEERDRRLEALGFEKQNIATEATNASQNELLAGLSGALSGVQAGLSLGSSISDAATQARLADLSRQQGSLGLEEQQARTGIANLELDFKRKQQANFLDDIGRGRDAVDRITGSIRELGIR